MIMNHSFMCEFMGTPEAGKTTSIKELSKSLTHLGYKVYVLRESAEIVPPYFEKGSLAAHFWMRLTTSKEILEAANQNYDIVLIDRGIFDSLFWNEFYLFQGKLSEEECNNANMFFENLELKPNLVISLMIPAEESIHRRGGEGRIVTHEFVKNFNLRLFDFYPHIDTPMLQLNTFRKSKNEVKSIIQTTILSQYKLFKNRYPEPKSG